MIQVTGIPMGSKPLSGPQVARKNIKQPKQSGHYSPYLSRMNNLCCKQVKQTKKFQSYRTKENFQIFHNLTCKGGNLIYLLQCICQLQYVGKRRPLSTINYYRKDAKPQASILAYKHFNKQNHNFQQHAEFTLTEQPLKKQEHFPKEEKISRF